MAAVLALLLALWRPAAAGPLPPQVDRARLEALLQQFVDAAYRKAFRHLGDERDFDHGHFLYDADAPGSAPVAILYHTQELAPYHPSSGPYGWIDRGARNWVQWLRDGRVENARAYRRAAAPEFGRHGTILAEMLEASAFGARRLRARQVVFTRSRCRNRDVQLRVRLPGSFSAVCLSLSEY